MGKNARTSCPGCGQLGFFKNPAGLCKNCTPPCEYCHQTIAGWNGEKMHKSCADRKHRGLPPKKAKVRKPKLAIPPKRAVPDMATFVPTL